MQEVLKQIKYYCGIATYQIKLEVQRQMEYPSFLLGWLIGNPLYFILGLLTIWVTVHNFGDLAGWTFKEMTFLYGASVMSHSISVILFVQTWHIHEAVMHGEFDRYFLRPLSVLFQFSVSFINLVGFTDMLPGLIVLIYGCVLVSFTPSFLNILSLIVLILCGTAIRGAIFTIIGSTAFFTKSPNQLTRVMLSMFHYTTMYPLSIYPRAIQNILTFLIPVGFINFYPVSALLHKESGIIALNHIWFIVLAVAIGLLIAACAFFNYGLSKYESAGN